MFKRSVSVRKICLIAALVFSFFAMAISFCVFSKVSTPTNTVYALGGKGTAEKPWEIYNENDFLLWVGKASGISGGYAKLMADIYLVGNWIPQRANFTMLDGNYHKIYYSQYVTGISSQNADGYGLFSEGSGNVENLFLVGDISLYEGYYAYVGGIFGVPSGAVYINNCYIDITFNIDTTSSLYVGGCVGAPRYSSPVIEVKNSCFVGKMNVESKGTIKYGAFAGCTITPKDNDSYPSANRCYNFLYNNVEKKDLSTVKCGESFQDVYSRYLNFPKLPPYYYFTGTLDEYSKIVPLSFLLYRGGGALIGRCEVLIDYQTTSYTNDKICYYLKDYQNFSIKVTNSNGTNITNKIPDLANWPAENRNYVQITMQIETKQGFEITSNNKLCKLSFKSGYYYTGYNKNQTTYKDDTINYTYPTNHTIEIILDRAFRICISSPCFEDGALAHNVATLDKDEFSSLVLYSTNINIITTYSYEKNEYYITFNNEKITVKLNSDYTVKHWEVAKNNSYAKQDFTINDTCGVQEFKNNIQTEMLVEPTLFIQPVIEVKEYSLGLI